MPASETSVLGKAGELRVASELLLRGLHPLIAAVDDGIDITLGHGPTLQVKTCRTPTAPNGDKRRLYYVFTLHALRERGNGGKRVHRHNMTADFAVLWAIGLGFYIVPRAEIHERHTLSVPTERRGATSQWEQWCERWDLLGTPD